MVKIYYFISVYLLLFACNNNNTQENNYIENDIDTIEEADYVQEITDERITREIKDKNYVIFVEPTLFYLDSLKNVSKDDDFYTTVDDATFYMTMASDLALEKKNRYNKHKNRRNPKNSEKNNSGIQRQSLDIDFI